MVQKSPCLTSGKKGGNCELFVPGKICDCTLKQEYLRDLNKPNHGIRVIKAADVDAAPARVVRPAPIHDDLETHVASTGEPDAVNAPMIPCRECGTPLPHDGDHFSRNRYGLLKVCKTCMRNKHKAARSKKIDDTAPEDNKPDRVSDAEPDVVDGAHDDQTEVTAPAAPDTDRRDRGPRLELGANNYDLYEKLKRYAKEDERDCKSQVVYILKMWVRDREEARQ